MLDGRRYLSEFPDDEHEQPRRLLVSDELLVTLAAIEREISEFIRSNANESTGLAAGGSAPDESR